MRSGENRQFGKCWMIAMACVGMLCASASGAAISVGPVTAGACGGADCDYQSIQAAIDASVSLDVITVYRRIDDPTNNECYDEHINVNVANVTIQGNSTDPDKAACIGTSTAGDIVRVTASGVTLLNLQISGKANNGAGGLNSKNKGGRHLGAGIRIYGDDIDNVTIENCTIAFTMEEQIRWQGDLNGDNNGNVTIRKCYFHHSDLPKNNVRIDGGSNISNVHVVEDNYMTTGQGIFSDAEYITVQKNIILGYPYWAHLVSNGTWPETHDYNTQSAAQGGGWRYFSRCSEGIYVQNGGAGTDIQILNNLIIGTKVGIRVQTSGTIKNNTVANPFNVPPAYGHNSSIDATAIRDATYGIMVVSGFAGTLQNNIVVVTEDNRATGQPGKSTPPYYTPGITGYGIGFSGGGGTLGAGASVRNNDVWGFVDTDGSTATNWGSGLSTCEDNTDTKCSDNVSVDPVFATDTSDETNDGAGGCDADAADTRCYELYGDNFFLSTQTASGGCHADIRPNTAAYVGFVDFTTTNDFAGLGDCSAVADASTSDLIDAGTGAVSNEPVTNGGVPNLGAFGNSDRGSKSPTLKIVSITASPGSVKNGTEGFDGPGSIIPRSGGLTQVNIDFNRAISATSSSFEFRNACGSTDLTAPTFDFSGATSLPYRVTLTWPASTFNGQWVRIHALGDGVNRIVDLNGDALDGEISDLVNGTLPSGNDTPGGDAQFMIGVLYGDVDGDRTVESNSGEDDRLAITGYAGYPGATCSDCPQDVDGDGDVDIQDRNDASGQDNDILGVVGTCYDVSGIAYQSDGTTPITGKAVSLVAMIDGVTRYTAESNSADGSWIIILIDGGDASVITLYLDGEVEEANLVTIADGVNSITGASLIENFLTIRSDDGANATTIADAALFDNDDNANEMLFTANGGSLVLEAGIGLRVETGGIFTPGGNVDVGTADTNATIAIVGTWNATGTETINVEGDWTLNGTFNAASGTVIFDGPGSGTSTFIGATTFYNLTCVTGGRTLSFPASTTTTVSNTLTLEGASNADLLLRSSSGGTAFTLSVGSSFQDNDGYAYLDYVDVKDCTATGSAASFLALDSVDSTGNTSWIFNTITVDTTADTSDNTTTSIKALFNSVADGAGDSSVSLRETLTAVANGDTIWFDTTTFPPGTPATIDVDTSALPTLSADSVLIDASNAGVIIEDTDGDLADGAHGLKITGDNNVIKGLRIRYFDGGSATAGVYITGVGNIIGGTYNSGAANGLGDGCQISLNYHGVYIDGVGADSNIIKGNLIGTDLSGTGDEGNTGYGVYILKGDSNVIGSTTSGEENRIAFNGDATYPYGIYFDNNATDNTARGNLIWDNNGVAISRDTIAQNTISAPTVSTVSTTQVDGTSDVSNTIDVYTNADGDSDCLTYVGSTTADGSGNWSLTGLSLNDCDYAVAIQIDASGSSSEVSNALTSPPADTGFMSPTAEVADTGGDGDGFELNPTDAFADGGGFASNIKNQGASGGDRHRYYDYGFSIHSDCSVRGIEVQVDWWLSALAGIQSLEVELSWDGGTSWTAAKSDAVETTTEHTGLFGGSTDTWGHAWTVAELSDANFRVRLTCKSTNNLRDFFLDWVPVKVYYGAPL